MRGTVQMLALSIGTLSINLQGGWIREMAFLPRGRTVRVKPKCGNVASPICT